jgi:hypothetical protein
MQLLSSRDIPDWIRSFIAAVNRIHSQNLAYQAAYDNLLRLCHVKAGYFSDLESCKISISISELRLQFISLSHVAGDKCDGTVTGLCKEE